MVRLKPLREPALQRRRVSRDMDDLVAVLGAGRD
jgi:hypothetical protein